MENEETIDFFHVSLGDFNESLEAFSQGIYNNNNEEVSDQSYFVQKPGFFFWNNKEALYKPEPDNDHNPSLWLKQWLQKHYRQKNFLQISCRLPKKDISYPKWQFDVKNSYPYTKDLLLKYIPSVIGKEFETSSGMQAGSKFKVTCLNRDGFDFVVNDCEYLEIYGKNASYGAILQSLNDELVKNPDYLKEYNALLQKSLSEKEPIAIKYTGSEKIPLHEAWNIQVNPGRVISVEPVELKQNKENESKPKSRINFIEQLRNGNNPDLQQQNINAPYNPGNKINLETLKRIKGIARKQRF